MPRPLAQVSDFWPAPGPDVARGPRTPGQIVDLVLGGLDSAALYPGDALPSSRALAARLGVPRGSVTAAYETLAAMGVVGSVAGSGTRIAPESDRLAHALLATGATTSRPELPVRSDAISLDPGRPDVSLIDERRWRRSWRHAAALPPTGDVAARLAELQEALAHQLRRSRAVLCEPTDIRLFPGVNPALLSIAAHLGTPIVMEDPGYRRAFDAFRAVGGEPIPVAVDAEGLVVDGLPRRRCVVYTTPAHQYPTGVRMSMSRRLDLIGWARATDSLIIEDDYDGEFSYDVAPLPALQRLDPDRVVYLGTASKALSPQLRIAWAVLPERCRAVPNAGHGSSTGVDATAAAMLAHFVRTGSWDNHIARATRTYGARRAAVRRALADHLPDARVLGVEAGLHLTLELGSAAAVEAAHENLARHGYRLTTLPEHALVLLSYAAIPETRADSIVRLLRAQ